MELATNNNNVIKGDKLFFGLANLPLIESMIRYILRDIAQT